MIPFLVPAFDLFVLCWGVPEGGFTPSARESGWQCGLCASAFSTATSCGATHRAGDTPTFPVWNPTLGVT
jgi:hypothetical protein